MPVLSVGLLGGLRVEVDGVPVGLGGPKPRRLLAVLVVAAGRPVSPDRLTDLVWPDGAPARPEASLQAYVSKLRRELGADAIGFGPVGYALRVDPSTLDVARFERSVRDGLALAAVGRSAAARSVLTAALHTWAPLLPEMADAPFVLPLARRLDDLRRAATEASFTAALDHERPEALVPDLRDAVHADPRSERLWLLLATTLDGAGRRADALCVLADARRALRDEAGLDPGAEFVALESQLVAGHGDRPPSPDPVTIRPLSRHAGRCGAVRGGGRRAAGHGTARARAGAHPVAPLRGEGVVRRP